MDGQGNGGQGPAPAAASWYPDPERPGGFRYWDGTRWTDHRAAAAPPPPGDAGTDGFAIASLILGIVGGSLLAVIFGFVARGRIKRSGGTRRHLVLRRRSFVKTGTPIGWRGWRTRLRVR